MYDCNVWTYFQVSARILSSSPFSRWRDFDHVRQGLMKEQLDRLVGSAGISDNVLEIANKSLN